jgi:hypothetical protein
MAFRAPSGVRCGDSRKGNWRQSGEGGQPNVAAQTNLRRKSPPIPGNYDPHVRNTVTTSFVTTAVLISAIGARRIAYIVPNNPPPNRQRHKRKRYAETDHQGN